MKRFHLLAFGLALLAGFVLMQLLSSGSLIGVLTQATIYAIFALGVGVLIRQNGLVSFGHALFFGMAGYGMGVLLHERWMPAEVAIVVVLLVIALFAALIGWVIVRVPGIAFGMLTLAIGQMAYLLLSRSRGLTGGADGMGIPWPTTLFGVHESTFLQPAVLFMVSWVCMLAVLFVLMLLFQTRFGAVTEAVRDNAERARFIGIRTTLPRTLVFVVSAVVTGIAGILSALNAGFISPESLHWSVSAIALLMAVVGGTGHLVGPILGAMIYVLFKDLLGDYATHSLALFGAILIAVIVFSPDGMAGLVHRLFHRGDAQAAPARVRRAPSAEVAETSDGGPRTAHEPPITQ